MLMMWFLYLLLWLPVLAQAAITEHQRVGGWNISRVFLWRLEIWDQGASMAGFWGQLSSWLEHGHVLSVGSRNRESAPVSLPLVIMTVIPAWGSILMTSSKPGASQRSHLQMPSHQEAGLQHEHSGGDKRSVMTLPFPFLFAPTGLHKLLGQGSANILCKGLHGKYLGSGNHTVTAATTLQLQTTCITG